MLAVWNMWGGGGGGGGNVYKKIIGFYLADFEIYH